MKEINEWLEAHRDELFSDLASLIEIPSVSKTGTVPSPFGAECRRAFDLMFSLGEKYGFKADDCDGYVGSLSYSDGDGDLGLWAHTDVVPADDDWDFEPFALTIKDGFAIGRGVTDDKGPCIELLYAMRAVRELGLDNGKNVRLFFGGGEETGMSDVEYFNKHRTAPPISVIADSDFPVCFGEAGIFGAELTSRLPLSDDVVSISAGTADNIIPAKAYAVVKNCKGIEKLDPNDFEVEYSGDLVHITAHGVSAHAAHPEQGDNALAKLLNALCGILSEYDSEVIEPFARLAECTDASVIGANYIDDVWGGLTYASTMMKTANRRLTMTVNCRYPMPVEFEKVRSSTMKFGEEHGIEMKVTESIPATALEPSHPAIATLAAVYTEMTGEDLKPYTAKGVTYAKKVPNALTFGPEFPNRKLPPFITKAGHGSLHQPDECVAVEEIMTAAAIYAEAVRRLCEM